MRRPACARIAGLLLCTVGLLASSRSASGQDAFYRGEYGGTGFYVGAAGAAIFHDQLEKTVGGFEPNDPFFVGSFDDTDASVGTSYGFQTRIGWRFHPVFAFENRFEWVDRAEVEASDRNLAEVSLWTLSGDLRAYLSTARLQPFAVLGLGATQVEWKVPDRSARREFAFSIRAGGGIEVHLTQQLALVLDLTYLIPIEQLEDFQAFSTSWGFTYHFR